jgi:S1-C subfamily serine protease
MSTYSPYPPRRPARSSSAFVWPWLVALALAGLLLWRLWPSGSGRPGPDAGTDPNAVPRAVTPRGDLAAAEKTTIDIFRNASPSVVHITTLGAGSPFSLDQQLVPEGTGSGFVWDKEGHIVTNYHVIQGVVERAAGTAGAAKVTLADHSTYDVEWARGYPDADLAVLWIRAPKDRLHPIAVGTSHDLQVGQNTFAIGNPFGLDHTLTRGIVSALDRQIQSVTKTPIRGVIQSDAAINPGNSGGPLLDSAGRLIGVNTAILSPSKASAGIGFAIPVDQVNRVVPQLIRHGKVVQPDLGAQLADDQLMRRLGLEGALVLSVKPDSPAAKAGLRPTRRTRAGRIELGDVIVAVDGQPVQSKSDFYTLVQQHKVGDQVKLTVLRDGQREDVSVTLEASA